MLTVRSTMPYFHENHSHLEPVRSLLADNDPDAIVEAVTTAESLRSVGPLSLTCYSR